MTLIKTARSILVVYKRISLYVVHMCMSLTLTSSLRLHLIIFISNCTTLTTTSTVCIVRQRDGRQCVLVLAVSL